MADLTNTTESSTPAETPSLPLVSVVVPVLNEQRYIERSLGAVLGQDYPAERFEVLVADGMSTDATREIIRGFQQKHHNLRLLDNQQRRRAAGLNVATAAARGDIIVRVDGHCEIDRDYLRRCVAHLGNGEVVGVGGSIETVGETPLAHAIAVAMSSRFGVGSSTFRTTQNESLLVDTIAFPAYTRRAVERAGPYDEKFHWNEDDEYNYRLRKLGGKLLLADDVHSRYFNRRSLGALAYQYFHYGYWKVSVMRKHPRQMQPRQFAPACLVGGLLVALVFALFFSVAWWGFGGLLGSYLLANLSASMLAARKESWRTLAMLPWVFATLHFSYGAGFLCRLFAFWNS